MQAGMLLCRMGQHQDGKTKHWVTFADNESSVAERWTATSLLSAKINAVRPQALVWVCKNAICSIQVVVTTIIQLHFFFWIEATFPLMLLLLNIGSPVEFHMDTQCDPHDGQTDIQNRSSHLYSYCGCFSLLVLEKKKRPFVIFWHALVSTFFTHLTKMYNQRK